LKKLQALGETHSVSGNKGANRSLNIEK